MDTDMFNWLLELDEPWTRYRTLKDLLGVQEFGPKIESR